ncbi:MAG: ribonuclease D [Saprospiraceae bacterium]|nr:ribonuclease D [Saprospiraceae bacterium]
MNEKVHFLEKQQDFDQVIQQIANEQWIGFDTEFVGEKSFVPRLCLLQIATETDIYLVDCLKIKNLDGFLKILENPETLKITHAGDNDYRLLYTLFGTTPSNTFDTQIAAGFVGYNYPAGFGRIVDKELHITLAKSHTVADWEARPLDAKAVEYAIEDVKYLSKLHEKLTSKLKKLKREAWAKEENIKWEDAEFYTVTPDKEFYNNDLVFQLSEREKLFLLRLYRWRLDTAKRMNLPKEQILQSKLIGSVAKAIKSGPSAIKSNRTLPEGLWRRNYDQWAELWKSPATDAEAALLKSLPKQAPDDPEREWTMDLLYHFIKKQCIEHEISAALLFPRGDFNKLKSGSDDFDPDFLKGWRAELMGKPLVDWLLRGNEIMMTWPETGKCELTMKAR